MAEIIKETVDENGNQNFEVSSNQINDTLTLATANTYVDKNIIIKIEPCLPPVTEEDEGEVLIVNEEGKWDKSNLLQLCIDTELIKPVFLDENTMLIEEEGIIYVL